MQAMLRLEISVFLAAGSQLIMGISRCGDCEQNESEGDVCKSVSYAAILLHDNCTGKSI